MPAELSTKGKQARRGRPPIVNQPTREDLIRLYITEQKSIREVAGELKISKDAVFRALKKYEISVRSNASRSRLRTIPIRDLEAAIREKGVRGAARQLRVDHSTLLHHMKVRSS